MLAILALALAATHVVPPAAPRALPSAGPVVAAPAPAAADSIRADRDVRLTALRNAGDVHRCYVDEGLRRQLRLEGVVEVELTIEATGVVSGARIAATTLRGPGAREVGTCIAATARQWRFERGPYLTEAVVFPFVLKPKRAVEAGRSA